MSKQVVVKIIGINRLPYAKINTIEGPRKIDHADNSISVSPKTASQMVDGINWKLADEKELPLLKEVVRQEEKRKLRREQDKFVEKKKRTKKRRRKRRKKRKRMKEWVL